MLIASVLTLALIAGPAAAVLSSRVPSERGPVLVIGPDAEGLVRAAGGRPVGPLGAAFGVLAVGDDGFVTRVIRQGAWKVTGGGWLAELCGVPQ